MINTAKICAIGISSAILCVILRQYKNEIFISTRIAGIITVFGITIFMALPIFEQLSTMFDNALSVQYIEIITKALGISYISHIGSEICKDCGEGNIGSIIETGGKIELLLLCLPLFENVLKLAEELLSW